MNIATISPEATKLVERRWNELVQQNGTKIAFDDIPEMMAALVDEGRIPLLRNIHLRDAEIARLKSILPWIANISNAGIEAKTASAKDKHLRGIANLCRELGFDGSLSLKDLADKAAAIYGCNCDLDNWEPNQDTGHSNVCRIDATARRWQRDGIPTEF